MSVDPNISRKRCRVDSPRPRLGDVMCVSLCGDSVLSFLSVKDIVLSAEISREWKRYSSKEIDRRAERWIVETSRAWELLRGHRDFLEISADEVPDHHRLAMDGLEDYWRDNFDDRRHMLRAVADWNGGWRRFLHTRDIGAKPQPLIEQGRRVEFTTLGDEDPLTLGLIFDIRCNGRHRWSSFQPIRNEDIGGVVVEVDETDAYCCCIWPQSTRTLGDRTDSSIIFQMDHGSRTPKFLFSTDMDDNRQWDLSVSIVSPHCSETLLLEFPIKSANELQSDSEVEWDENVGIDERHLTGGLYAQMESAAKTIKAGWYQGYDIESVPRPEKGLSRCRIDVDFSNVKGLMNDDGDISIGRFSHVVANCLYWLDRRKTQKGRLHLSVDLTFNSEVCSDMLLNP